MDSCPICGMNSSSVLASELRRGFGQVLHCQSCNHGFLKVEEKIDLEKYYREDYRREYAHKSESSSTNAAELFSTYSDYQTSRLNILGPWLNDDTSILEIGASAGQFLTHIRDKVGNVSAIELDSDCYEYLTEKLGINADTRLLQSSKFANEKYDVVCAFQVMEHVDSPLSFLNDMKSVSKFGGSIFVEVPNIADPLL